MKTPTGYVALRKGRHVRNCIFIKWCDAEEEIINFDKAEYIVIDSLQDAEMYIVSTSVAANKNNNCSSLQSSEKLTITCDNTTTSKTNDHDYADTKKSETNRKTTTDTIITAPSPPPLPPATIDTEIDNNNNNNNTPDINNATTRIIITKNTNNDNKVIQEKKSDSETTTLPDDSQNHVADTTTITETTQCSTAVQPDIAINQIDSNRNNINNNSIQDTATTNMAKITTATTRIEWTNDTTTIWCPAKKINKRWKQTFEKLVSYRKVDGTYPQPIPDNDIRRWLQYHKNEYKKKKQGLLNHSLSDDKEELFRNVGINLEQSNSSSNSKSSTVQNKRPPSSQLARTSKKRKQVQESLLDDEANVKAVATTTKRKRNSSSSSRPVVEGAVINKDESNNQKDRINNNSTTSNVSQTPEKNVSPAAKRDTFMSKTAIQSLLKNTTTSSPSAAKIRTCGNSEIDECSLSVDPKEKQKQQDDDNESHSQNNNDVNATSTSTIETLPPKSNKNTTSSLSAKERTCNNDGLDESSVVNDKEQQQQQQQVGDEDENNSQNEANSTTKSTIATVNDEEQQQKEVSSTRTTSGKKMKSLNKSAKPSQIWKDNLTKLKQYMENNNGNWRVKKEDDPKLRTWILNQESFYLRMKEGDYGYLNDEKIKLLQDIGVQFDKTIYTFTERIEQLKQYQVENGNLQIPYEHPILGEWVQSMKRQYKRMHHAGEQIAQYLDAKKINELRKAGVVEFLNQVQPRKYQMWDDEFDIMFTQLQEFKEIHKTCNIIKKQKKEYKDLYNWCVRLKLEYQKLSDKETANKSRLSTRQIVQLNEMGFSFEMKKYKSFEEWVEQLKIYQNNGGDITKITMSHPEFGEFISRQRRDYRLYCQGKKTQINEEKIKMLENIGFTWNVENWIPNEQKAKQLTWDERLQQLIEYKELNGHLLVPKQTPNGLGHWVRSQRRNYKLLLQGRPMIGTRLTPERVQKLSNIGFIFDASEYRSINKQQQIHNVVRTNNNYNNDNYGYYNSDSD